MRGLDDIEKYLSSHKKWKVQILKGKYSTIVEYFRYDEEKFSITFEGPYHRMRAEKYLMWLKQEMFFTNRMK